MHADFRSYSEDAVSQPQFFPSIPMSPRLPNRPVAIADMADMFGVTHRTLHFYEEKRLIKAGRIGAMRVYGPQQIKLMALINLCRETGMAIAQIQELLAELSGCASQEEADAIFRLAMQARQRELISSESLIRRQMQQVHEALDHGASLAGEANDNDAASAPLLSDFEIECLSLMSEGYSPIRIGNTTGRGVDEILSTEAAIIRKFGSTNRFQAVAKAVLLGMIRE